jgi:hypothetical protein
MPNPAIAPEGAQLPLSSEARRLLRGGATMKLRPVPVALTLCAVASELGCSSREAVTWEDDSSPGIVVTQGPCESARHIEMSEHQTFIIYRVDPATGGGIDQICLPE